LGDGAKSNKKIIRSQTQKTVEVNIPRRFHFITSKYDYFLQLQLQASIFHTPAANTAPINGATMKIHKSAKALPPAKTAGPIERAGFTEVPV
jgi:hypothetical protein